MVDISIEFDNTHGVFVPGFEVTGSVIFNVPESPLKARAVIISVDGRAYTHWTVSERHSSTMTQGQTQTSHRTVTYSACVPYASGEAILWSPAAGESSGHIPVGTHRFPFRFNLPSNCPPSYEGSHGYIRYFCKAKIDRPWKFDHTTRRVFTVVPTFDLNLIPSASLPVSALQAKDLGVLFFKHGKLSINAKLLKGGYVPGEGIVLQAEISNGSSRPISKVELKLVEYSTYIAYRNGAWIEHGINSGRHSEQRAHRRTVSQFEEKVDIGKGSTSSYSRMIPIPPVVPTFNTCPIINVSYSVKVKVTAQATLSNTLSVHLPVLIGTIPIRQYQSPISGSVGNGIGWQNGPTGGIGSGATPAGPSAPPLSVMDPPPSYEESVFGKGTMKDEEENKAFAPRYVYYPNITPSAPPLQ